MGFFKYLVYFNLPGMELVLFLAPIQCCVLDWWLWEVSEWLCGCLAAGQVKIPPCVPKSITSLIHSWPTYLYGPNKWVKLYFSAKGFLEDTFALFLCILSSPLNLFISISLLTYSNQTLK